MKIIHCNKTSHGHSVNSLAGEFRRSQPLVSVNSTLSFQLATIEIHRGAWSSTAGRLLDYRNRAAAIRYGRTLKYLKLERIPWVIHGIDLSQLSHGLFMGLI